MAAFRRAAAAVALAWLLHPAPALPANQTTYTSVYIPSPLENGGHSARAQALGSAFTAVEGDPACLYSNPAGLSGITEPSLSLTHQAWVSDITQDNLQAAFPLKGASVLGLGVNYLGTGPLQGYDASGSPTLSFQPSRISLTLGWGVRLFPALAVGLSARGFYQSLAPALDGFASSLAAGFLWKILPGLSAGGFYSFLESDASPELGQLKGGLSYQLHLFGGSPALLTADLALPPQGVYQVECGAEQLLFGALTLRLGNQWDLKDNQIGGFRGFTMGAGFRWGDLDLDASFAPDGDLGSSQMAGLTWWFPSESKKPAASAAHSLPAVNFAPPSQISANDKAVHVEMQFNLAGKGTKAGPAAPAPSSPQLAQDLQAQARKVQENPKDAPAWQTLGSLYWRAGQPDFAVQCFQEALQLRPDNGPLKDWLEQYRRLHPPPSKAGE